MFSNDYGNRARAPQEDPEPPPAPTACPFCGSAHITTATEKIDPSRYWRCETCGELWNLGRIKPASRSRY